MDGAEYDSEDPIQDAKYAIAKLLTKVANGRKAIKSIDQITKLGDTLARLLDREKPRPMNPHEWDLYRFQHGDPAYYEREVLGNEQDNEEDENE